LIAKYIECRISSYLILLSLLQCLLSFTIVHHEFRAQLNFKINSCIVLRWENRIRGYAALAVFFLGRAIMLST